MTIGYTRLTPGEVPTLRAMMTVFGKAFGETETYLGQPPDDAYLEALLGKEDFVAIAASEDDAVVGGLVAYVLAKPERARSEIYLYDLAVAERHRRRGIATALIHTLREIGAGLGAYVIFVQADHVDEAAIALYRSLGDEESVLHFDIRVP